ncbi:MAG: beta strand repeat-containing protein, partial [Bacteroidota bacterium]
MRYILALLILISGTNVYSAEIYFNHVYKGTGSSFTAEPPNIAITTRLSGTGFRFQSDPPDMQWFSGNNVLGNFIYVDASGNTVSYRGIISRRDKTSGAAPNSLAFYFYRSETGEVAQGEAFLLVVSGKESTYTGNQTVGISSDPVDDALNDVLRLTPIITLSGTLSPFSTCSGTPSATQTLTVSGSSLSSSITVNAPAGYEISTTGNVNTFTSTLTFAASSGSVTTTTFYIRLKSDATNSASGDISASSTDAVTKTAATGSATVTTAPTISGTTPNSRCGDGTVILGATASAGTISWYTSATGGTAVATGTSYTTGTLTQTTTFYVDATSGGCTTASRTSVIATINPIPTISSTTPASRCGTGTVNLGASASAGTINWYDASTGGSLLGTGTSFTTPSISSTTTYYVDATSGSCTTASRTAVIATVTGALNAGTITGTTSVCTGSDIQLTSNGDAGGTWSSSDITLASVNASTGLVTGVASGSVTITYTVSGSGCVTSTATKTVTINTTPNTPSIGTITQPTCSVTTGSVELSGLPATGNWTVTASDGTNSSTLTGTGATATYSGLTANKTYTFTVTNASGCTSGTSSSTVINAAPTAPAAPSVGTITQPTCSVATASVALSGLPATGNWTVTASDGTNSSTLTGTGA